MEPARRPGLHESWSVYKILHAKGNVKSVDNNKPRFVDSAEIKKALLYNSNKAVINLNRIRDLRIKANLKQTDLARKLSCSPTTISNYEVGIRDIDSETINKLCEIFGCTADYLLGRSELPTPELNEEEARLLQAFRRGDDRARDMVRLALAPFSSDAGSSATA